MNTTCLNGRDIQIGHRLAIGAALGLTIMCGYSPASANLYDGTGGSTQGRSLQGRSLQGRSLQGDIISSGLEGPVLIGTLADGSTMEVLSFSGVSVDATIWDATTNEPATSSMPAQQLVGLTWTAPLCTETECVESWYRISAGGPDFSTNTMPARPSNGDVWLYRVEYSLDGSEWDNACDVGPDGTSMGIFVDGTWDTDGEYSSLGYTFSCSNGVIAKCARGWGYKPWLSVLAPDGSVVDLQPFHQTCTRAARADYCGTGEPHTIDGLLVDIFDVYGLNVHEDAPGYSEEASFDIDGALSLKHKRLANEGGELSCRSSLHASPPPGETPLLYVWSHPHHLR